MSKLAHSNDETMMQIEANAVRRANAQLRTSQIALLKDVTGPKWIAWIIGDPLDERPTGHGPTEAAAILDLAEKLGLERKYD